jgi:GT2 family glycosyltransferase
MSNSEPSRRRACVADSAVVAAEALAAAGFDVTVLDTGRSRPGRPPEGVRLVTLPPSPVRLRGPAHLAAAYRVYHWLKKEAFDLAVFPLSRGLLYYAAMARRSGLALNGTRLALVADRPTLCIEKSNCPWPNDPLLLEVDFMEREAVERADALVSSDAAAGEWLNRNGWKRPTLVIDSPTDLAAFASPAEPPHADPPQRNPMVTVCLVHHNRPALLAQAIQSLRDQQYEPFEVVLIDNGSHTPEAVRYLDSIEPEFAARGWRLVRQENRYASGAYNTAARLARGEYLLLMEDDNYAKPDELSAMVRAAQRLGADAVACSMDIFYGDETPAADLQPFRRHLFLGGCATAGLFRNCLTSANALISRKAYEHLEGFTEVRGAGREDWEFFAEVAIRGYRFAMMPEALYWYRASGPRVSDAAATHEEARENNRLRPYLDAIEPPAADLIRLLSGFQARLDSPMHRVASRLESACRGHPRARRFLDWCARRLTRLLPRRA